MNNATTEHPAEALRPRDVSKKTWSGVVEFLRINAPSSPHFACTREKIIRKWPSIERHEDTLFRAFKLCGGPGEKFGFVEEWRAGIAAALRPASDQQSGSELSNPPEILARPGGVLQKVLSNLEKTQRKIDNAKPT
jgi:hypothetical protein